MIEFKAENRLYYKSTLLEKTGLVNQGFSCRLGGVSQGKIQGFNLGFRVGDNHNSVMENYRLMSKDLSFDISRAVLSKQTHTDNIRIVSENDMGKGLVKESDIQDTDGLITNLKNVALIVFSADCTPILLLDPIKNVIGAVHAGWRGTVQGIGGKAVKLMKEAFGSNPQDIIAAIGPSIGPCCFEFSTKDAYVFPEKYHKKTVGNCVYIDLWNMNKDNLKDNGVLSHNIEISSLCTICHSDIFYSYRIHKEHTGRQTAVIMLK